MLSTYENEIRLDLYFYGTILLVPIGLIMNILLFIGYNSKSFCKGNIGFQIQTTTIFCSLAYFWNIVVCRYLPLIGVDIAAYSPISCVLVTYLGRVLQQIPFYLLLLITYFDYLSIKEPYKHKKLNTKHNLIVLITIIVVIILILNLSNAIKHIQIDHATNGTNKTNYECVSNSTINIISVFSTAFLRFFLPFGLLIMVHVRTVRELISQKLAINATIDDEKKLVFVLIVFNFLFFAINFPLACCQILSVVYDEHYQENRDYSKNGGALRLAYDFSRMIAWASYIIAFVFNLIFNKLFRKILLIKLKKIKRKIF